MSDSDGAPGMSARMDAIEESLREVLGVKRSFATSSRLFKI